MPGLFSNLASAVGNTFGNIAPSLSTLGQNPLGTLAALPRTLAQDTSQLPSHILASLAGGATPTAPTAPPPSLSYSGAAGLGAPQSPQDYAVASAPSSGTPTAAQALAALGKPAVAGAAAAPAAALSTDLASLGPVGAALGAVLSSSHGGGASAMGQSQAQPQAVPIAGFQPSTALPDTGAPPSMAQMSPYQPAGGRLLNPYAAGPNARSII